MNNNKELRLVEEIQKRFKARDPQVVVGIGDDAAVVRVSAGTLLVYTVDMLVEGVHFRKKEDPQKVGHKALAVSVSDIAAMGGVPRYALVSVGMPARGAGPRARRLVSGLKRCAKDFGIHIIGGDMNRSSRLVVDVFVAGTVSPEHLVRRSGAKPGDHIFVTGRLGGSLKGKHLSFRPRLDASRYLVTHVKVHAMIDLSDGLSMDLNRVCNASSVGALIFEEKIPRTPGVSVRAALEDGEDFELLFTVDARDALTLHRLMAAGKTPGSFYPVGKITNLIRGVRMVTRSGRIRRIAPAGFSHFSP